MAQALVKLVRRQAPDFVIHCGDLTADDTEENCRMARDVMEDLGCPWYGVPGNHDTRYGNGRALLAEVFDGDGGVTSFARVLGGVRFLFLDVVHWLHADGSLTPRFDRELYDAGRITGMGPSQGDRLWLERVIAASPEPVIVVSHAPAHFRKSYPIATLPYGKPVSSPETAPEDFISGFIGADEGRREILETISGGERVKACLSGHWHFNDAFGEDGRLFMITGALRELPYEVRLLELDGGGMRVKTLGLDVPDLTRRSFVKEWGNSWVKGPAASRDFVFQTD